MRTYSDSVLLLLLKESPPNFGEDKVELSVSLSSARLRMHIHASTTVANDHSQSALPRRLRGNIFAFGRAVYAVVVVIGNNCARAQGSRPRDGGRGDRAKTHRKQQWFV